MNEQATIEAPPAQAGPDTTQQTQVLSASAAPQEQAVETPQAQEQGAQQQSAPAKDPKYDEFEKKSQALDRLVQDQKFVEWYQNTYGPGAKQAVPQATGQANPPGKQEVYQPSNEELMDAASDPVKYANLMEKMLDAKYQERFKELETKNKSIELSMEFEGATRRHPDFWEMDKAGVMEPFIHYFKDVRKMGIEDAYQQAKKVEDFFMKKAKAQMQGVVNDRRQSVTEGTSTATSEGAGLLYASNSHDMLRMQLMENLPGGLKRKVVLRK